MIPARARRYTGMSIVIASGSEWLAEATAMGQRSSRTIAVEPLNSITADCVKPIAVDEQALRTARAEAFGDHFE